MKKLIWKLRYAFYINTRSYLAFSYAWSMAEDAYKSFPGESPIDSAIGELECWSE